MIEVGSVRPQSVQNILFKNLVDACLGAFVWLFFGWGFAYGHAQSESTAINDVIGTADWALHESSDFINWFFQWAFAATAATIVSGSVAERVNLEAYFIYTIIITGFIYPVVVHWVWDGSGWLYYNTESGDVKANGMIDFAGSGVVHMVGGLSGLMGAIVAGPRKNMERARVHSVPFQVFGTFILWFGWYGFNCGSTLAAQGAMSLAARVACNTTLGAAGGGLGAMLLARGVEGTYSVSRVCNGILAGLVSVTANCHVIDVGSACVIGLIGSVVYFSTSRLLQHLGVDDVLDAAPVHGFCGIWGCMAAGLFSTEDLVVNAYGAADSLGTRFGKQLVGIIAIGAWTVFTAGMLFVAIDQALKLTGSALRITEEVERKGIDKAEHGGSAWSWKRNSLSAGCVGMSNMSVVGEVELEPNQNDTERAPTPEPLATHVQEVLDAMDECPFSEPEIV